MSQQECTLLIHIPTDLLLALDAAVQRAMCLHLQQPVHKPIKVINTQQEINQALLWLRAGSRTTSEVNIWLRLKARERATNSGIPRVNRQPSRTSVALQMLRTALKQDEAQHGA